MKVTDYVEIKESKGSKWLWTGRHGHVITVDKYCLEVETDDGETIRDVREHFRNAK